MNPLLSSSSPARILFCLVWALPLAAAETSDIRWNELATVISGHTVSIPLPGGVTVGGEALSVRNDVLVVDIDKTSDARHYPLGPFVLPRGSITEVRVERRRGSGGKLLGSLLGLLIGMVGGAEVAAHGPNSELAAVSSFTAVAAACTVGGYYLGRNADHRWKVLRVMPGTQDQNRLQTPSDSK